jgi:hypothetical protein
VDLAAEVGPHRLVLGTHAPLLYPESALLKLREAGLEGGLLAAVQERNAREARGESEATA